MRDVRLVGSLLGNWKSRSRMNLMQNQNRINNRNEPSNTLNVTRFITVRDQRLAIFINFYPENAFYLLWSSNEGRRRDSLCVFSTAIYTKAWMKNNESWLSHTPEVSPKSSRRRKCLSKRTFRPTPHTVEVLIMRLGSCIFNELSIRSVAPVKCNWTWI